ncbi:MAG: SAM-dependent methyltransferase, partial [Betaproteobacteria bacterium]|nr:SAM-dependent methyltransferase [Betaproteobacteria bacterium]
MTPVPLAPSDWVTRWVGSLPSGSRVLDLACGSGRHV